jgi:hypothetical protein
MVHIGAIVQQDEDFRTGWGWQGDLPLWVLGATNTHTGERAISWDEHAQKAGRTAVTQPPAVAKKRAWVVHTHSQFEDRLRS